MNNKTDVHCNSGLKRAPWVVFYVWLIAAMLFAMYYTILSMVSVATLLSSMEREWWMHVLFLLPHCFGLIVQLTMITFAVRGWKRTLGMNRRGRANG